MSKVKGRPALQGSQSSRSVKSTAASYALKRVPSSKTVKNKFVPAASKYFADLQDDLEEQDDVLDQQATPLFNDDATVRGSTTEEDNDDDGDECVSSSEGEEGSPESPVEAVKARNFGGSFGLNSQQHADRAVKAAKGARRSPKNKSQDSQPSQASQSSSKSKSQASGDSQTSQKGSKRSKSSTKASPAPKRQRGSDKEAASLSPVPDADSDIVPEKGKPLVPWMHPDSLRDLLETSMEKGRPASVMRYHTRLALLFTRDLSEKPREELQAAMSRLLFPKYKSVDIVALMKAHRNHFNNLMSYLRAQFDRAAEFFLDSPESEDFKARISRWRLIDEDLTPFEFPYIKDVELESWFSKHDQVKLAADIWAPCLEATTAHYVLQSHGNWLAEGLIQSVKAILPYFISIKQRTNLPPKELTNIKTAALKKHSLGHQQWPGNLQKPSDWSKAANKAKTYSILPANPYTVGTTRRQLEEEALEAINEEQLEDTKPAPPQVSPVIAGALNEEMHNFVIERARSTIDFYRRQIRRQENQVNSLHKLANECNNWMRETFRIRDIVLTNDAFGVEAYQHAIDNAVQELKRISRVEEDCRLNRKPLPRGHTPLINILTSLDILQTFAREYNPINSQHALIGSAPTTEEQEEGIPATQYATPSEESASNSDV